MKKGTILAKYRKDRRWDILNHILSELKGEDDVVEIHYLSREFLLENPSLAKIIDYSNKQEDVIFCFKSEANNCKDLFVSPYVSSAYFNNQKVKDFTENFR